MILTPYCAWTSSTDWVDGLTGGLWRWNEPWLVRFKYGFPAYSVIRMAAPSTRFDETSWLATPFSAVR